MGTKTQVKSGNHIQIGLDQKYLMKNHERIIKSTKGQMATYNAYQREIGDISPDNPYENTNSPK